MKRATIILCLGIFSGTVHADTKGIISTVVPHSSAVGGVGSGWFHHLRENSNGGTHYGLDINADPGMPVFPAYDGVIEDYITVPSNNPGAHDYGNAVLIRHVGMKDPNGRELYSIYLHLDELTSAAKDIGEPVYAGARGTRLGGIGITGASGGYYHTHFELRWFGKRGHEDWSHPTLNGSISNLYYVTGSKNGQDLSISYSDWVSPEEVFPADEIPVYRFWNDVEDGHFFTSSYTEAVLTVDNPNYTYENIAYSAFAKPTPVTTPLYRFYHPVNKKHFYTADENERNFLIAYDTNWLYEGYVYDVVHPDAEFPNANPIHRFYSETYKSHFFTISNPEKNYVINSYPDAVWRFEGEGFKGVGNAN